MNKRDRLSCDLIDHLKTLGVDAAVGYRGTRGKIALIACPKSKDDWGKVPAEYQGYPVTCEEQPELLPNRIEDLRSAPRG